MDELLDIDMWFNDREWTAIGKAADRRGKTKEEYIMNLLNPKIERPDRPGSPLEQIVARAFLRANRIRVYPTKRVKLKPRKYGRL